MELAEKIYAQYVLFLAEKLQLILRLQHLSEIVISAATLCGKCPPQKSQQCSYSLPPVVNAKGFCSGSFSFGGPGIQQEKLEAEGVIFVDGHVDMERFEITPDDFEMMRTGLV